MQNGMIANRVEEISVYPLLPAFVYLNWVFADTKAVIVLMVWRTISKTNVYYMTIVASNLSTKSSIYVNFFDILKNVEQ